MKEVVRTLVVGRKVEINTTENDSVDIRCGGPRYLGYDFVVDADENPKELEKFLKQTLNDLHRSYIHIWISPSTVEVAKEHIWDHARIKQCIEREVL